MPKFEEDIKYLMRKKDELLQKRQDILDRVVHEQRGLTSEETKGIDKKSC
jgi:hypothetical protein